MRKLHLSALAVLAAFALACGGGATNPTSGSSANPAGTAGDEKTAAATAKIGQPARDGKFEFTVTKVKCGVARVGTQYLGEKAQGQFCLVTVKVKNIAKEAQTLSSGSQLAFGADGAQFEADSAAGIYIEDNDTLFNNINPGNSVTGVLVFDIPKNGQLTKLELHDSPFSGGVAVTVK